MSKMNRNDDLTRRVTDLTAVVNDLTRRISIMEGALRDKAPGVMPTLKRNVNDLYGPIKMARNE